MSTIQQLTTTAQKSWHAVHPLPSSGNPEEATTLRLGSAHDRPWWGFGGCFNELGWIALSRLNPTERDAVMRDLFDPTGPLRFRYCRVPIGASDYAASWYSHNETPGDLAMNHFSIARDREHLLPFLRAALALQPDLRLFASAWSPPTWMKFPQAYNHGRLIWTPEIRAAYALYLARFVEAYREEGLPIHAIHVQNEPDSDQKFPSCCWTGETLRDFIRDDLGPCFSQRGLDCEIWLGTIERGDYAAWVHPTLADPAARDFVSGLGFQWAGRDAIPRAHQCWPDLPKIQTENECGDGANDWKHACHVFDLLCHYLHHGVRAYTYWNMVLEQGGVSTWGWRQNSLVVVDDSGARPTHEFHVMRHLAEHVAVGANPLSLSGPWSGLATAFRNPDGTRIIALRNPEPRPSPIRLLDETGRTLTHSTLPPDSIHTFLIPNEPGI